MKSKSDLPTLDLHGCTKDEALAKLDQFLFQQSRTQTPRIRVMTGKGLGILRKEVSAYLKLGGYHFEVETLPSGQKNEGVFVVFMN